MASTESISDATGSRVMIRLGAVALALSGLLFFLYPAVRPWHDESILGGAVASMSSNAWVAAHVFAILALILMPPGMLALFGLSAGTRGAGLTLAGTVIIWVGAGLTLPYYGAEDFALYAFASQVRSGTQLDLLGLVHSDSVQCRGCSMFAAGLALLALGGVLVAISIWGRERCPQASRLWFVTWSRSLCRGSWVTPLRWATRTSEALRCRAGYGLSPPSRMAGCSSTSSC
jgi:hypothetical protein